MRSFRYVPDEVCSLKRLLGWCALEQPVAPAAWRQHHLLSNEVISVRRQRPLSKDSSGVVALETVRSRFRCLAATSLSIGVISVRPDEALSRRLLGDRARSCGRARCTWQHHSPMGWFCSPTGTLKGSSGVVALRNIGPPCLCGSRGCSERPSRRHSQRQLLGGRVRNCRSRSLLAATSLSMRSFGSVRQYLLSQKTAPGVVAQKPSVSFAGSDITLNGAVRCVLAMHSQTAPG
jgi:hypothetical protein